MGKWQQLRPWMSAKQPRKTSDGQVGNCCHHPLLSHTSMLHWQHVADTQEAACPRLPAICAIAGSGPHGIRGHRQQSVGPLCLSSSSWLDFLLPLLRQWAVMVVTVVVVEELFLFLLWCGLVSAGCCWVGRGAGKQVDGTSGYQVDGTSATLNGIPHDDSSHPPRSPHQSYANLAQASPSHCSLYSIAKNWWTYLLWPGSPPMPIALVGSLYCTTGPETWQGVAKGEP